jgi:hypothetical protein
LLVSPIPHLPILAASSFTSAHGGVGSLTSS